MVGRGYRFGGRGRERRLCQRDVYGVWSGFGDDGDGLRWLPFRVPTTDGRRDDGGAGGERAGEQRGAGRNHDSGNARSGSESCVPVRLFDIHFDDGADQHGSEQFLPVGGERDAAELDEAGEKRERVQHVRVGGWSELGAVGDEPDGEHGGERVCRVGGEQSHDGFFGDGDVR